MRSRPTSIQSHLYQSSDEWISRIGKAGYLTKGVVYTIVGVLAVKAAVGLGGSTEGTRGAIASIANQPFGQVLLALTAFGLFTYALWRFVEAVLDPGNAGSDARGIAKRIGYFVSGVIYLGLSIWTTWILLGSRSGQGAGSSTGGGEGSRQQWTAELLSQPFGRWIVGGVGAAVIITGLFHFYSAYKARFMKHYDSGEMSAAQRKWARRIGRFGLSARSVTFLIIGGFFIQAALQYDPSEARGLGAAFQTLAGQPYGPWLMGIVAAGFVSYGIYCGLRARYSRFSLR